MPEYLHPGVYIEEQPAPQTIEGVSTSTAGFVGAAEKGPTSGLPQMVTSFNEFLRRYGGYLPEDPWGQTRCLAYAVEGFFNNGGQRVFISRIAGAGAAPSALTLNDGFVTRLTADTASDPAQRTAVRLTSLRGVSVGASLRFEEVIAGAPQANDRIVLTYDSSNNVVTLNQALEFRYTAVGATVILNGVPDAPAPTAGTPSLRVFANSAGTWGRGLSVSISDARGAVGLTDAFNVAAEGVLAASALAFAAAGPATGATTAELDDASSLQNGDLVEFDDGNPATPNEQRTISVNGNAISWQDGLVRNYSGAGTAIRRLTALRAGAANPALVLDDVTGFAAGDLIRISQGGNRQVLRVGAVDAPNDTLTLDTGIYGVTAAYTAGATVVLGSAGADGSTQLNLRSARNFYPGAVIEVDDGAAKSYHQVESIAGNVLTLAAALGGAIPGDAAVRIVEFNLLVTDGVASELFERLAMNEDAPNFVQTVVNPRSNLVQVEVQGSPRAIPFNLPQTNSGGPANLRDGNDGGVPGADAYIGQDNGPGQRTGIRALADIDEISILAAPGISDAAVQGQLIIQCETLKDRFAVLDPAVGSVVGSGRDDDVIVQRSNHDTLYAAMYYPWLRIRDPLYPDRRDGSLVPPSGHMIGIYARVDTERGVHKAPANEVVRGIAGLEVKLGDRDQDRLNPININVLRDFRANGRGFRVWGARVITSDNAWKYIPVRRMFIFLEESMDEGLQWAVFEPNGEDLWARVRQTLSGFLRTIWLSGALRGVTEEEAFFVRCDRTTMTEDDIANGRLIVLVGVAPLHPAEFVIIRIGQKTLEAAAAGAA